MKKITALILCVVLICSLIGCGGETLPDEITVLTIDNYLPTEQLKEFTKKTGIKVNNVTAPTYEKIQELVEQDPAAYDLVIACDYVVDALVIGNLLHEIDYKNFENNKYVIDGYKSQYYDKDNKFTVPYAAIGILIGYDPYKAGIIIDSYGDLLAPELANSVVFADDWSAVTGIINLMLDKEPTDGTNLNDLIKIMRQLALCKYPLPSNTLYPEDVLISGDAAAGLLYTSQLGYAVDANPNLEIVYPKEGFLASIDCLAIPAQADGIAGAMKFINFVHDPVVNGKFTQEIGYSTTNISGRQFMDEEYRNDGYCIKNDHALECILTTAYTKQAENQLKWCYNKYFINTAPQTQSSSPTNTVTPIQQ